MFENCTITLLRTYNFIYTLQHTYVTYVTTMLHIIFLHIFVQRDQRFHDKNQNVIKLLSPKLFEFLNFLKIYISLFVRPFHISLPLSLSLSGLNCNDIVFVSRAINKTGSQSAIVIPWLTCNRNDRFFSAIRERERERERDAVSRWRCKKCHAIVKRNCIASDALGMKSWLNDPPRTTS